MYLSSNFCYNSRIKGHDEERPSPLRFPVCVGFAAFCPCLLNCLLAGSDRATGGWQRLSIWILALLSRRVGRSAFGNMCTPYSSKDSVTFIRNPFSVMMLLRG